MTIEINRAGSAYIYRISPADPLLIERRRNQHNARWCFYLHRDSVNEARQALLQLEKEQDDR